MTKQVKIGNIVIGGGAPIAVQSMLNVHNSDIEGNVAQAVALEKAGCEIVRVSVPNAASVALIPAIKNAISIPLVADIHFDGELAIKSVEAGVDKVRIKAANPHQIVSHLAFFELKLLFIIHGMYLTASALSVKSTLRFHAKRRRL